MKDTSRPKKYSWKRISLIVLCSFLAVVLLVMIFVTAYVGHIFSLIGGPEDESINPSMFTDQPTLPPDFTGVTIAPPTMPTAPSSQLITHPDLVNIMLVGQDRRPGENYNTRSDAMILCTVNRKTGTVSMTSFMRDLYVTIPGRGGDKMNAAYAYGGMSLLSKTMELNFGVKVDGFITVDFTSFQKVVEILGGVGIELTQAEAQHLNEEYGYALSAGYNHLNGEQALNYSRIRKLGSDFARTERQRKVLTSILNGCRSMSLSQANALVTQIAPLITTDMDSGTLLRYVAELFPLLSGSNIVTQRIPIDGSYELTYVGALDVVLPDLEVNRQYLYDTLMP